MTENMSEQGVRVAQENGDSCLAGVTKSFWYHCSVLDALQSIRNNLPRFVNSLMPLVADKGCMPLLFLDGESKVVSIDDACFGTPENWFYIGDIHADFYALHTLLQHIQLSCTDFKLVFLGDLVDRGDFPVECIVLLLVWAMDHPGRVVWIAGNHDIAFARDAETGLFTSSVIPSEFVNTLNEVGDLHELNVQVGEFFMALAQRLPRALLFPDGLFATHGGFPLTDLQAQAVDLTSREEYMAWLNSAACLQDVTWTRITRYRKRMPNRLSKGCSYGFLDFDAFCNLKPEWFPVKRMVTGHEHVQEGFHLFQEYLSNPALTLTGLGFDELSADEFRYSNYRSCLTAGRHQRDALPAKVEVPVDKISINQLRNIDETQRDDIVLQENTPIFCVQ